MAWVSESLELEDIKKFHSNLSKLPKEVLKRAFHKGFISLEHDDSDEECEYNLCQLADTQEGLNLVESFIKDAQSRGYIFELDDAEVFDVSIILSKLIEEDCETKIAIRHKGGDGIYPRQGIPKEYSDKVNGYIELSDDIYYTSSPQKKGKDIVTGRGVVLYSTKPPLSPEEIVLSTFSGYYDIYISNIVLFEPEVVYLIMNTDSECSNKSDYTSLSISDSFCDNGNYEGISRLTKTLVRCCPCLLNDYTWDYKTSLPQQELVDLVSLLGYYEENIHKIYMEADTPKMCSVITNDYIGADVVDKFLKLLLSYINVPIKECYIIDRDCYLKGNVIGRKCNDGEYIVTIY